MFIRALVVFLIAATLPISALANPITGITAATVFSSSTAEIDITHNTATSQRADIFTVELIGRMQGGAILYDQAFNLAFSDPVVQAAIFSLEGILTGSGATSFLGPNLLSTDTSLLSIIALTIEDSRVALPTDISSTFVGPLTIAIGDLGICQSYVPGSRSGCVGGTPYDFTLAPGQADIDLMVLTSVDIYTTTTTTNTYLTTAVYEVDGVTASTAVPEPATMLLFGAGLAGLAAVGRRKRS